MFGVSRMRHWLQRMETWDQQRGFRQQLKVFRQMNEQDNRFTVADKDLWAFLSDATSETPFDAHYTYHPAWAVRVVKKINPGRHVDISSTLQFCSTLSAFIPVDFYDYRPARLMLTDLYCGAADLTNLSFETGSIESLSCMHTIEHVGLGRYGDPLDPSADVKALKELQRVTRPGGSLLIVTPVGQPKIQFNGQRIYSFELINDLFGDFELRDFSLVTDSGGFINQADPNLVREQQHGCGCFWYIKKPVNKSI
jgi:SAM-dependent methyltransferase